MSSAASNSLYKQTRPVHGLRSIVDRVALRDRRCAGILTLFQRGVNRSEGRLVTGPTMVRVIVRVRVRVIVRVIVRVRDRVRVRVRVRVCSADCHCA